MNNDTATRQTLTYDLAGPPDNTTGARFVAQVPCTDWTFDTSDIHVALQAAWELSRHHETMCVVWDFAQDGEYSPVDPNPVWVVGAAYIGE